MIPLTMYLLRLHQIAAWIAAFSMAMWIFRARWCSRRRLARWVVIGGISLTLASGLLRHTRHAGTVGLTTYGWPKPIYSVRYAPETAALRHEVHWRGIAELRTSLRCPRRRTHVGVRVHQDATSLCLKCERPRGSRAARVGLPWELPSNYPSRQGVEKASETTPTNSWRRT